jgi:hypothetical protein
MALRSRVLAAFLAFGMLFVLAVGPAAAAPPRPTQTGLGDVCELAFEADAIAEQFSIPDTGLDIFIELFCSERV